MFPCGLCAFWTLHHSHADLIGKKPYHNVFDFFLSVKYYGMAYVREKYLEKISAYVRVIYRS